MAALPDFEAYQRALAAEVGGFGGPKAQQWFGFTGRQKTAEIQILRDWRDVERYPDTCGDDALPLVASTFAMPRFYGESLVDWRARVVDAWDLHTLSGSAPTVEALLLAAGAAAVTITEAWQVDPTDENYTVTEFEVELTGWEQTVLDASLVLPFQLGHNIDPLSIREMVRIILRHSSAHCLPHYLTIDDGSGGTFDFPIHVLMGDDEFVLPFKLGAPLEY